MLLVNGDNYNTENLVFIGTVNVISIGDIHNIVILFYIGDFYNTEILVSTLNRHSDCVFGRPYL